MGLTIDWGKNKYIINDEDNFIIKNSKDITICNKPLENIKILYFNASIVSRGIIIVLPEGFNAPVTIGAKMGKKEEMKDFFNYMCKKSEFLDLSFFKASAYVPDEVKEVKEAEEAKKVKEAKVKEEERRMAIEKHKSKLAVAKDKEKVAWIKLTSKEKKETECTCGKCGTVWYYDNSDITKNKANHLGSIGNILNGNSTTGAVQFNNMKDLDKCPKCGSHMIKKEEVTFNIDKNGNYLE